MKWLLLLGTLGMGVASLAGINSGAVVQKHNYNVLPEEITFKNNNPIKLYDDEIVAGAFRHEDKSTDLTVFNSSHNLLDAMNNYTDVTLTVNAKTWNNGWPSDGDINKSVKTVDYKVADILQEGKTTTSEVLSVAERRDAGYIEANAKLSLFRAGDSISFIEEVHLYCGWVVLNYAQQIEIQFTEMDFHN